MNKKIRNYALEHTKSFWLNLDTDLLVKRLDSSKKRPLLSNKNIKLTLEKIYNKRKNTYSLANYKIDCNNLTIEMSINKIIKIYDDN